MSEKWRKVKFVESRQPDTGPVAYLRIADVDGDECDFLMPEELIDTILRDHQLAQSHSKGMAILAGEIRETRARIAELEAERDQSAREADILRQYIAGEPGKIGQQLLAAEAETARFRELVEEACDLMPGSGKSLAQRWWKQEDWLARAEDALAARETAAVGGNEETR